MGYMARQICGCTLLCHSCTLGIIELGCAQWNRRCWEQAKKDDKESKKATEDDDNGSKPSKDLSDNLGAGSDTPEGPPEDKGGPKDNTRKRFWNISFSGSIRTSEKTRGDTLGEEEKDVGTKTKPLTDGTKAKTGAISEAGGKTGGLRTTGPQLPGPNFQHSNKVTGTSQPKPGLSQYGAFGGDDLQIDDDVHVRSAGEEIKGIVSKIKSLNVPYSEFRGDPRTGDGLNIDGLSSAGLNSADLLKLRHAKTLGRKVLAKFEKRKRGGGLSEPFSVSPGVGSESEGFTSGSSRRILSYLHRRSRKDSAPSGTFS